MNEDAYYIVNSYVITDMPPHSPCPAFTHESSVLGCIGQGETLSPDVLPQETPCALQVSGWTAVDSSDVRLPIAKSQLDKSSVIDLKTNSLNPKVRPDVLLGVSEILKRCHNHRS